MKIHKLPEEVIKRIAAGEVIDSPAAVVRELIENSIDAYASKIEGEIMGNGLKLIKVKDNGTGIEKEDLPLLTKRYTTSKIQELADLHIKFSLGFRGEALYSISQVSHLEVITGNGEEGWHAIYEGEELKELYPAPPFKGTIVKVRDVFYNYPVRRKFVEQNIRKIRRELKEVLFNFFIAYHKIDFRIRADKELYIYPSTMERIERLIAIFGEEIGEQFGEISYSTEDFQIYGLIKKPQYLSGRGKNYQYVFVNNRRVNLEFVKHAIRKAFGNENVYPSFFVFIDTKPYFIDFNIHPQKKEVKLLNEQGVFKALYAGVKRFLQEEREVLSAMSVNSLNVSTQIQGGGKVSSKYRETKARQLELGELFKNVKKEDKKTFEGFEKPNYVPERIFQVHNSYIIAEVETGVIIVDQHAAHERIIYEKLKSRKIGRRKLLFPIMIELSGEEIEKYKDYKGILESFGFEFKEVNQSKIIVEAVPEIFDALSKESFRELLEDLEQGLPLPEKHQYVLKTIACKAAIKAGQPLTKEEMAHLLDELFACEVPFFCPHGRPLIYKISLLELEKKFGRR